MPEYDAVFYEAFQEEESVLREVLPENRKYFFTWKTVQESNHKTPPSSIISTRTQSIIPLDWAEKLSAIITRSTGYDHITEYIEKASNKKILTAYLPDYAARAVAEQAMLLWTALLRDIRAQEEAFKTFNRDGLTGKELRGRKILIAGVGKIGGEIADIAHGLGMKIMGVDIKPNHQLGKKLDIDYVSFEDGLSDAEIMVCALPLTSSTRGMLNYQLLSRMPRGSIFINIARGEISPAQDLVKLLKENILHGVGLDVYDHERELAAVLRDEIPTASFSGAAKESLEAISELMKHPHVIMTPHNAFNTAESVKRKSLRTAENLRVFFDTGTFLTPIDRSI
ncbi:MAG: hypothetical protein A2017_16150 [Lentisphaerae bacterium GWF2_44_16]|nr:MAG: hypothetical protein A2017_16150 [Lentisphaerae bacterium GWF2_44_16]